LVVGTDGRRLAKRHGDTTLARFRDEGVSPERIVGWLAAVSGLAPAGVELAPGDLLPGFDLGRLPTKPVVFDGELH
jgi:glutamyl-tRNA synthetase